MTISTPSRVRSEAKHWAKSLSGNLGSVADSCLRLSTEIEAIMQSAGAFSSQHNSQKIAVLSGHGLNALHLSTDALWTMALRHRGHNALGVICDRGIPACEFNFRGDGRRSPPEQRVAFTGPANAHICSVCTGSARRVIGATRAPVFTLRQFGQDADEQAAFRISAAVPAGDIRQFEYRGVPVGDHAFSSTLRSTLRGEVAYDDPDEMWIYRRELASSIMLVDRLNRLIDQEKPDKFVGIHGVYLMHGTMADVCRTRGIPAVIYGMPYRKGTIWFSHRETYHHSLVKEPVSFWNTTALDTAKRQEIDVYMRSREVGGRDNVNYHPNPILDRENVVRAIGLDPARPIVSMFTNVIWDAQIVYPSNAFENIFDWIYWTIEYFRTRSDLQLVIRIHPAETKGGFVTRQPMYPEIMARYPNLPPNIFVLPSESDVGSYTLAEMSRACLIYGTKMGVEIAYRGIPVIVAGESFNRGKGFTYDVSTKDEYRALLDKIQDLPRNSDTMTEAARRYAYYFFYQKMMDIDLLTPGLARSTRVAGESFYTFTDVDALDPGRSRTLDVICNGILEGSPLFTPL